MATITSKLIALNDYCWWGGTISFYLVTDAVSINVDFTIYTPGSGVADTWSQTVDVNGILTTTRTATKAVWGVASGQYTVKANVAGTIYEDTFKVDYKAVLIRYGLEDLFHMFQNLEMYDEQGVVNSALDTIEFGYQKWIRGYTPRLIKNENENLTISSVYKVDYENGKAYFGAALVAGDEITATYKFKYFSENWWGNQLDNLVNQFNARKPSSSYNANTMPAHWDDVLIMGAYLRSLKTLLLDINLWKSRLIFPDAANTQTLLITLMNSAQTEYNEMAKTTKRRGDTTPRIVSSYQVGIPRKVTGTNFAKYTLMGSYSVD